MVTRSLGTRLLAANSQKKKTKKKIDYVKPAKQGGEKKKCLKTIMKTEY